MTPAGKRNQRIQLLREVKIKNGLNESQSTWPVYFECWATKTDVSDLEKVRAAQVNAIVDARFVILNCGEVANLSAADRLTHRGVPYNIRGVKAVGDDPVPRELEISAYRASNGKGP